MHENQEISSTPWSDDQGRSAKATSRTADMYTPDGSRIISGSFDMTLRVWDSASGSCLQTLRGHTGRILQVALTVGGKRAISLGEDQTLRVWDLEKGEEIVAARRRGGGFCLALSPNDKVVALSTPFTLVLVEIATGFARVLRPAHIDQINAAAFSSDGNFLISGSSDRTLRIWSVHTEQAVATLKGHNREIWSVAVSSDGRYAASVSDDRTIAVWALSSNSVIARFRGEGPLIPCAISADGGVLVTADEAGAVHLLQLES